MQALTMFLLCRKSRQNWCFPSVLLSDCYITAALKNSKNTLLRLRRFFMNSCSSSPSSGYRHITAVIPGSQSTLTHSILFILLGHSPSPAGLPVEYRRKLPPPQASAAFFFYYYKRVKVTSRISGRKSDIVFKGCLSPPGGSSHAAISAGECSDEKSRAPLRVWEGGGGGCQMCGLLNCCLQTRKQSCEQFTDVLFFSPLL